MDLNSKHHNTSLSEVNSTVQADRSGGFFKRLIAFLGPAYLVSVGYMDPGNWATDIAGGSRFGYSLLWVLLMSNLMALLLQGMSARLGIVSRRDLAQASRDTYPGVVNFALYMLAEIAIAACDLAEVLGMAIGLNLLFHLPLLWGVGISVLDTFLLMFLINFGIRKMEAFIICLVAIIGVSFLVEMVIAGPSMSGIAHGFIPVLPDEALYIAIGIIGATVMPHNLYLHSSLVQTRKFERTDKGIFRAIRYNIIDSAIALNLAFFVNAAILILAASVFYKNGMFEVAEIQDAHKFLEPLLGTRMAPALFAIALIAAGQSSTITGTLAGQIIMEGYLNLRIQPWLRRIITRLLAVIPALLVIHYFGESATGKLLVLSQVILSMQLGFAVIPLIHFVSDKGRMGKFAIGPVSKAAGWICAALIVGLNVKLVVSQFAEWLQAGPHAWYTELLAWLILVMVAVLLLLITFQPLLQRKRYREYKPHGTVSITPPEVLHSYHKIAVTLDFSDSDQQTITTALAQGGKDCEYLLVHVLETAGAFMMGNEIRDLESESDRKFLEEYRLQLIALGYRHVQVVLGFGNPKHEIPKAVKGFGAELLVIGAHGHKGLKDVVFGTTVDVVRHRVEIPVLIVR